MKPGRQIPDLLLACSIKCYFYCLPSPGTYLTILAGCLLSAASGAQDAWMLEISSSVELRTLKLTNKAEQNSRPIKGATIALYEGSKMVKQVVSDAGGDFSIMVPPDGDFIIVVSYPQCNPKKFAVSTRNVPANYDKEGWEPAFPIGGVIMAKPLYSIDYSALQQPMAKVFFKQKGKVFDDDDAYTDEILQRLKQIKSDEDVLISKFLEAVNAGDAALKKPDCPLAKAMYEKALKLIPNEEYPIAQLAKVGDCLKAQDNKVKEEAEQKARAEAEKLAKEKAEQAAREKEAQQLAQQQKAEEESKRRAAEEKAAEEKKLAEKKALSEAEAKKKAEADARRKQEEELAREEAKRKAGAEKAASENEAKRNAAAEKERREKEEADRKAQQALAEKSAREKKATEEAGRRQKAEEEKLAKQKAEELKLAAAKTKEAEARKKGQEAAQASTKEKPAPASPATSKPPEPIVQKRTQSGDAEDKGRVKSKKTKYVIPQVLGVSQYQQVIKEADEHFQSRNYSKAKQLYTRALELKPADAHASGRLDEIRLMQKPE